MQSSGRDYIMVCQEQIKARHSPGRLIALADCLSRKENIVQTVVTESASDRPDISHLGYSSSGSICYSPEQEITAVRVTYFGPGSICNRRPESELDWYVGVCLSSLSSHSLMSEKDSER